MSLCGSCGQRFVQSHGLCRSCERAAGFDTRTTFEREHDRLEARSAPVRRRPIIIERPWPIYVDHGVELEVVWDGQFGALLEDRRRW